MGRFLGEVQVAENAGGGARLVLRVLLQVGVDCFVVFHERLRPAYCAQIVRHLVEASFTLGEVFVLEKLVILHQLHLCYIFALITGKFTPFHFPLILLLLLSTFEQSWGYEDHLFMLYVACGQRIPQLIHDG